MTHAQTPNESDFDNMKILKRGEMSWKSGTKRLHDFHTRPKNHETTNNRHNFNVSLLATGAMATQQFRENERGRDTNQQKRLHCYTA